MMRIRNKLCTCEGGRQFRDCCSRAATQPSAGSEKAGWIWSFLIFLIALVLRLGLWVEAQDWILTRTPILDSAYYLEWANRIVAGKWSGGVGVYPASPGYPHILAALLVIFGKSLDALYVAQCFASSLSCVFVFWLANRFFSTTASVCAALLLAIYGPSVFYSNVLLKAAWIEFFNLALLAGVVKALEDDAPHYWLLSGTLIGISMQFRPNLLIYLLLISSYLLIRNEVGFRTRLARLTLLLLGVAIITFPVVLRNKSMGGAWALSTSHGGMNFYTGNRSQLAATYKPLPFARSETQYEIGDFHLEAERRARKPLTNVEASSFWYDETFRIIRSNPVGWLKLLGKKFFFIWNNYEQPINLNLYFHAEKFRVTALLSKVGFWLILPLGIMGALISIKTRALIPLHLYVAAQVFSLVCFFVVSEYRHPLASALIIYAAGSIDWLRAQFALRAFRTIALASIFLILVSMISVFPDKYALGYKNDLAAAYMNLGAVAVAEKKWEDAANAFNSALRLSPGDSAALCGLGEVALQQNRINEAINRLTAVMQGSSPPGSRCRILLARAYWELGDPGKAKNELDKAIELDPANSDAIYDRILVLRGLGQKRRASAELTKLLAAHPQHQSALLLAAQDAFSENRRADGFGLLLRLQSIAPDNPGLNDTLGVALAADGRYREAKKAFERALASSPDFEPARKNLERIHGILR